ncbi:MAG: prepilin-type N-terminal cleavage/methylation domain-containing protein [Candidatus Omnitrophica bacterium]|nr:prepilin-type N-terminal cleavage/methylation domain-containing protein [Candidatus Omnitrophota bacterium]
MKERALTMLELIAVIVIVGIIATVAFPMLQNVIEDSATQVCDTNLKAIKTGLDLYIMERGAVPGSISEIPDSYLEKGFAKAMSGKDAWKKQMAYRIIGWRDRGLAYAQLSIQDLVKGNVAALTCPKDKTPPAQGGRSYCLNPNLANINGRTYQTLSPDVAVVSECDQLQAGTIAVALRHQHYGFGVGQNTPFANAVLSTGVSDAFTQSRPLVLYMHSQATCGACLAACGTVEKACENAKVIPPGRCKQKERQCNGACSGKFSDCQ